MLTNRLLGLALLLLSNFYLIGQDCSSRPQLSGFSDNLTMVIEAYTCDLAAYHDDNTVVAHGDNFLDWHRNFIRGLEDYLLSLGYDDLVPFPMWDPCAIIPDGALNTCSAYINPNDPLLAEEDNQIDCAIFSSNLYRDCNNFCDYPSFLDFQHDLKIDHFDIHREIGGVFNSGFSPAVLLFWSWHAFIDDVYLKYQVANLTDDVELGSIGRLDKDCCEQVFRFPKSCCLVSANWSLNGGGEITETGENDEYFLMRAIFEDSGFYSADIEVTSTCGAQRIVLGKNFYHEAGDIPVLPEIPPSVLENLCFDQKSVCYDFGNIACLKEIEVTTSHPQLIVEVNGTELCLQYIFRQSFTGTIDVTPIGNCGEGETVTWVIHANDGNYCGKLQYEGKSLTPEGKGNTSINIQDEQLKKHFQIYPNPFSNQITIDYLNIDDSETYTTQFIDMYGRILKTQKGNEFSFDTSLFPDGLYVIKVLNEKNEPIFIEKYIKQ